MTQELLIKFLNDKCTDEELKEVLHWIKNDSLNNQSKNWGYQDWTEFKTNENLMDNDNLSSLLDKIHHKININKQNIKNPNAGITTWLTRAAAILLIPVLAFLFYTISEKKSESINYTSNLTVDSLEIIAPAGSRTVVQLSDGSEVHLNYGSKLKYPQNFTGDTRGVILLGEGYFNIAHNPEKPFIVKTGKLNVKALGTKFNVQAYPGEEIIATTLVEGKVVVEQKFANGNIKTIGAMEPGQHVNYDLNSEVVSCTKGSVEKYIAWKDGKLVFENESIVEVTDRLSRMFNVDFEVADNVKDYSYTVTFVDEPLFQILDLMTIATPVTYKALPRKKLPDGTFSKQKIVIEKRK
jgi:ferric-dicitrate binding protein FerR (iron transport regulator)